MDDAEKQKAPVSRVQWCTPLHSIYSTRELQYSKCSEMRWEEVKNAFF